MSLKNHLGKIRAPEGEEGESPLRHEPDDREDPEGLNRG